MDVADRITQALAPLSGLPDFLGSILMNEDGDIVENQLPVSDDKAAEVIAPLWSILMGLKLAGRDVKSLHISSGSHHYSSYLLEDNSYLAIRFSETSQPDEVSKLVLELQETLKSCVADFNKSLFIEPVDPDSSSALAHSNVQDADPDAFKYLKALTTMMSQIVPAGQALVMVNRALDLNDYRRETLQKSEFSTVARTLIESVTNDEERATVQKEYDTIAAEFGL